MFQTRVFFTGLALLSAIPVPAWPGPYDCDLTGFDQTPPPAMVNPEANAQSFDWGSDVDTIKGNRGLLFWHYIRNRVGNKPLWVTWNAAGLGTSAAMPLPGGGTVCKQTQVFFQIDHPPDIKTIVNNDAPILYGARGESQDASIYRPVPPLVAQQPAGEPSRIRAWFTHLVGAYEDRAGAQHRIDVTIETSQVDGRYTIAITNSSGNAVVGISRLSELLKPDQFGLVTEAFRKQGAVVEPGTLPPPAAEALFRPKVPPEGQYLFVGRIEKATASYAGSSGQIPRLQPASLVVLDNERHPILSAGMALLVPSPGGV